MLKERKNNHQKGMFLISSFFLLSVVGIFSLALFLKSTALYRAMERTENQIRAFQLAESGVDRAIVRLRTDSSYTGQGYTALGSIGGYDVQVQTPDSVNSPTIRRITASGYAPSNLSTSYAYSSRQVVANVNLSNSPFLNAIFAKKEIELKGNVSTDSYNSNTGVVGTKGDIGTNGKAASVISLKGNSVVKGNAVVGPGANVATAITVSANSVIQGTKSAASTATVLNPVVIPPNLNNLGPLSVSGNNTVTKPGGTYWFSSISIRGNGKVNFTGPATVYVSRKIKVAGNGIGTAQGLPPNLLIYVQGSKEVRVSRNANVYSGIYAPNSKVEIDGNGKLYGAVVGSEVELEGNGRVRYDEALQNISGPSSTNKIKMKSWQET